MSESTFPSNPKIDWRARTLDWAFTQGPGTVLLFAMCVGLWYGIPWGRACMKEDMQAIQAIHRENMAEVVQAWDRHIDKTITAFKDDQERDAKMLERAQQLNERLLNERGVAKPNGFVLP